MFVNNKILVVIPAKGSSKSIPRKNVRLLHEKPLIGHVIDMAKASEYVDDIVVTTDDSEIALIADKFGVSSVRRSEELAEDDVPLDPVIYDALIQKEKQAFDEYDIVITIQPTSPLLKISTLDRAIEKFDDFGVDTVISVVDDRHLSWGYNENEGRFYPLYQQRLNRQYLPANFRETGSILASRRAFVNENSRLGENIDLIEISKEESVDIHDYEDWWIAENYLNRKKVAIVVEAFDKIGTGHIYRCLSLASKLVFHDIVFLLNQNHPLGIDIVKHNNYPYIVYDDFDEFMSSLAKFSPNIVINDILDTSSEYISILKNRGYFVINFEDLGSGSNVADLVFNALYKNKNIERDNIYTGHEYYLLKDDFLLQAPKIIKKDITNVLITFGGTDPNNLTEKVLDALISSGYSKQINVVLGLGYPNKDDIIEKYKIYSNVQIYKNVRNMSEFMFLADIVFTSAGRTMYEICSLGVPCICLCQNERELTHVFGNYKNGFINMGLGHELSQDDIIEQFNIVANDFELREAMNKRMLQIDLKHGFDNIFSVVKSHYRNFLLDNKL